MKWTLLLIVAGLCGAWIWRTFAISPRWEPTVLDRLRAVVQDDEAA